MIVNFRTISNKLYKLELNPSDTVSLVKQKLAQEYGLDSAKMKLIFKAKILSDNETLQSFGINGKGFIVLHTAPQNKLPDKPKEQIVDVKPKHQEQKAQQIETPKMVKNVKESPKKEESYPTEEPLPSFNRANHFLDPPNFHENVEKLMAMGFSECDCENALRAAVGNMDRAADFLLSGYIPEVPNLISVADIPVSEPRNISFDEDDDFFDDECDEIPASEIDDGEEGEEQSAAAGENDAQVRLVKINLRIVGVVAAVIILLIVLILVLRKFSGNFSVEWNFIRKWRRNRSDRNAFGNQNRIRYRSRKRRRKFNWKFWEK